MKFLRAIAAMVSLDDADELSPAAREDCHRDQVWAERDHVADKLNADRRAAFESLKDLLRLASQEVRPRKLGSSNWSEESARIQEIFGPYIADGCAAATDKLFRRHLRSVK